MWSANLLPQNKLQNHNALVSLSLKTKRKKNTGISQETGRFSNHVDWNVMILCLDPDML